MKGITLSSAIVVIIVATVGLVGIGVFLFAISPLPRAKTVAVIAAFFVCAFAVTFAVNAAQNAIATAAYCADGSFAHSYDSICK